MAQKKGHQKGSPSNNQANYNTPNQLSQSAVIDQFRSAIQAAGITPPDEITADGSLYRFSTNGKPGDKSGAYKLHLDGVPAGYFEDFRQGIKQTWKANTKATYQPLAELQAHKRRLAKQKAQRLDALAAQHQSVADEALNIWRQSPPAPADHAYLVKKQVKPHTARLSGPALLIPLHDVNGKLWSLQEIHPNGYKKLHTGGKKVGNFCLLNARLSELEAAPRALMVEGWATGATVAEMEPDSPVIVAIDSGNLIKVVGAIRRRFPHLKIVIVADNDRQTEQATGKNPGLSAANATAAAFIGVSVVKPEFPDNAPIELSDMNDLRNWLNQGGAK